MISPHTPPGTKVVALKTVGSPWLFPGCHIVSGRVYTIARIEEIDERFRFSPDVVFGAELAELDHSPLVKPWGSYTPLFPIKYFRRLDLPKEITELLNTKPVDKDERVKETV